MLPDGGGLKATTMGTQWTIQTISLVASLKASRSTQVHLI
jgi:hypothetical protein